jgi:hypothetical protein
MKHRAIFMITIIVFVCLLQSICLGQEYWSRTYGGPLAELPRAVIQTRNGDFVIAATRDSLGMPPPLMQIQKMTLLRTNSMGELVWLKHYEENMVPTGIAEISGNNVLVLGGTTLRKVNASGDITAARNYNLNGSAFCGMCQAPDGNAYVFAVYPPPGTGNEAAYLMKIDQNLDTLWTRTFPVNRSGQIRGCFLVPDGSLILTGLYEFTDNALWIKKISSDGTLLKSKTYRPGLASLSYCIQCPDGSFAAVGDKLFFFNSNLDSVSCREIGLVRNGYYVSPAIQDQKGNLIFTGCRDNGTLPYENIYLKATPSGRVLWNKSLGLTTAPTTLLSTQDKNYLLVSCTNIYPLYDIKLTSIIGDHYISKDSLFTFKIPCKGDSLKNTFSPLKAPSGMTVSAGGTISWTPKADSGYMEHIEYIVRDDKGSADTLTFNVFVNYSKIDWAKWVDVTSTSNAVLQVPVHQDIGINTKRKSVTFIVPQQEAVLVIYDMFGRVVKRLSAAGSQAVWNGINSAGKQVSTGRYYVKPANGKTSAVKSFAFIR